MSVLIVGGTGTLGRQIVKQALDEGYQVKCLVRDFRRGAFLRDWGAELIYGDLTIPETIPLTLKDAHVVIDASTIRSTSTYTSEVVDWSGKVALIEAAKFAGVKKMMQFSILDAEKNASVPLLDLKLKVENRLKSSGLNYTIFQCSGFFQGLISQYAVPVLDNQKIWLAKNAAPIAYLDTQDAAKAVVQSISNVNCDNAVVSLIGEKFWTSAQVVELCEKLSGKTAKTSYIPTLAFGVLRRFFRFFESTWNIADRLQFGEIASVKGETSRPLNEVTWPKGRLSLEAYLQEYFSKILKKLKETNYQQAQQSSDMPFL